MKILDLVSSTELVKFGPNLVPKFAKNYQIALKIDLRKF